MIRQRDKALILTLMGLNTMAVGRMICKMVMVVRDGTMKCYYARPDGSRYEGYYS